VNISLTRPNDTIFVLSNVTDSNGVSELLVNKRFYDLYTSISGESIVVNNVNFTNVNTSGIYFNIQKIR
jgi:hypothetical protein